MAKTRDKAQSSTEPVVTTLGIVRNGDGWSLVTLKVQGDKIVSKTLSNPDVLAITKEAFKIAAIREVMPS